MHTHTLSHTHTHTLTHTHTHTHTHIHSHTHTLPCTHQREQQTDEFLPSHNCLSHSIEVLACLPVASCIRLAPAGRGGRQASNRRPRSDHGCPSPRDGDRVWLPSCTPPQSPKTQSQECRDEAATAVVGRQRALLATAGKQSTLGDRAASPWQSKPQGHCCWGEPSDGYQLPAALETTQRSGRDKDKKNSSARHNSLHECFLLRGNYLSLRQCSPENAIHQEHKRHVAPGIYFKSDAS